MSELPLLLIAGAYATALASILGLGALLGRWALRGVDVRIAQVAAGVWASERANLRHEVDTAIEPILTELHPNGGESLRDAVDRTEVRGAALDRRLDHHLADSRETHHRLHDRIDRLWQGRP